LLTSYRGDPYKDIYDMTSDNKDLCILIYNIIMYLHADPECINSLLKILSEHELPYQAGVFQHFVIDDFSFDLNIKFDKRSYKEMVEYQTGSFCRQTGFNYEYIDADDRFKNRVILSTNQLLSEKHAPSKIVFDTAYTLIKYFDIDVRILVHAATFKKEFLAYMLPEPVPHYISNYNGDFHITYRGIKISGFQFDISSSSPDDIIRVYNKIIDFNPLFVWNIGRTDLFSESIKLITSYAAMPCVSGFELSDADYLIRYMKHHNDDDAEEEKLFKGSGKQRMISIGYAGLSDQMINDHDYYGNKDDVVFDEDRIETPEAAPRKELGLPDDKFLIALVGNRLDIEINHEFILLMKAIVKKNPEAAFVLIGENKLTFDEDLNNRTFKLGYRADYLRVIKSLDLFLNPNRVGAGGGGTRAVYERTPVITLPGCDVANTLSDDFKVDSYDEIPSLVYRYIHDAEFMSSMKKECDRMRILSEKTSNLSSYYDAFKQISTDILNSIS
jgi:hypothetical protein